MSTTFGEVVASDVDELGVSTIEIRRPPANYFDTALIQNLLDALAHADGHGARAVVLCSEGKHFCAGMNFQGDSGDGQGTGLYALAADLVRQPVPVVAAIQGAAIGGGLGLALTADFRVAEPTSRLHANFVQIGLHHGFGLTVTLPEVVGPQRAAELLLTGRPVPGTEAVEIGLVDRLAELGQLRAAAAELAKDIASNAPLAVRSVRATLRAGLANRLVEATKRELEEQLRLKRTDDFHEGVAAGRERRTPRFAGQ